MNLHTAARLPGKRFRSRHPLSPGRSLAAIERSARWMPWMVRVFYLYLAYRLWSARLGLFHHYTPDTELYPLWPVFWTQWVRADQAAMAIGAFLAAAAILAVLVPQYRWVRILFALALLEYLGLNYSFGKIGHGMHLAFWISILLIVLPRGWHRPRRQPREVRMQSWLVLAAIQVAIGLSYSLSGFWKLLGALWQGVHGHLHVFHPRALELHITARILQTQEAPLLAEWVLSQSSRLWPLLPLAVLIQLFSLVAALRPRLHLLWGALLISIHLGITFTMGIHFRDNIALLVLFFLLSPAGLCSGWSCRKADTASI